MEIKVERTFLGSDYTVGKMYIDGEYFSDTLEDTVRDLTKEKKVYGKTAIPAGRYEVILNYSPKFKKELPRLLNVPHFDGILIHCGVTPEHTEGCILIGENKVKGQVLNGRYYQQVLVDRFAKERQEGKKSYITITNR